MLGRRLQTARKDSYVFRTLPSQSLADAPPALAQPSEPVTCDQFFATLNPKSIPSFLSRFESLSSDSLQTEILASFPSQIQSGEWGDPGIHLSTAIEMLKNAPEEGRLRLIVDTLLTLPLSRDLSDRLFTSPESLLWWTDLVTVSPTPTVYSTSLFTFLQSVHSEILNKTLSLDRYCKLQRLSDRQLECFMKIMHLDRENEDESVLKSILLKSFQCLSEINGEKQRIEAKITTNFTTISHFPDIQTTFRHYSDSFPSLTLKDHKIPDLLKSVLTMADHYSVTYQWIEKVMLGKGRENMVLAIDVEDFVEFAVPKEVLTEEMEGRYVQRIFLDLCFPQFLLFPPFSCLSCSESSFLTSKYYDSHIRPFPSELEYLFDRYSGGLVGVFTHDTENFQGQLSMMSICQNAGNFINGMDLMQSLDTFLVNSEQRVYILDYFWGNPAIKIDLEVTKSILEMKYSKETTKGKMVCLIVHIPGGYGGVKGKWHQCWQLRTVESLSKVYQPYMQDENWVKFDTKTLLTRKEFLANPSNIKALFTCISSQNSQINLDQLANSDDFRQFLQEKVTKSETEFQDWKDLTLGYLKSEESLNSAIDKALLYELYCLFHSVFTTIFSLNAFDSLLLSPPNSLTRLLWYSSVSSLPYNYQPTTPAPPTPLKYPFIYLDYDNLTHQTDNLAWFAANSMAVLHVKTTSAAALTLLSTYMEDIMEIDMGQMVYAKEGKVAFRRMLKGCRSFEEAVETYFKLRELILSVCKSQKVPILEEFFANMTEINLANKEIPVIKRSFQLITDELQSFLHPGSRLYVVNGKKLSKYSSYMKEITTNNLDAEVSTKDYSMVMVNVNRLLLCGGVESSWWRGEYISRKTYQIILPFNVNPEEDMKKERCYHGVAVSHGFVYALGGAIDLVPSKSSEKYDLNSGKWSELSHSLTVARAYFNPITCSDRVFLIGGGSDVIECIDPSNDDLITRVPLYIPRIDRCSSVLLDSSRVLVLFNAGVCEVDLENRQSQVQVGRGRGVWANSPPVVYAGEVIILGKDLQIDRFPVPISPKTP